MIIFPAIDIINGKPVRLYKGDFATARRVADDVVKTAVGFEKQGARWAHIVDLDGSLKKEPVNGRIILAVARETSLKVEVGGGIRSMNDIEYYINGGAGRVILGSAALKDSGFVKEAVREYGDAVAVGIDAKNGYAAAEGWTEDSDVYFTELAKRMEDIGVKTIIYTDISKDGTLAGPNIAQLSQLKKAVSCNITASGGIRDINDITALKNEGLYGAICGKSLYEGTLALSDAIEVCK